MNRSKSDKELLHKRLKSVAYLNVEDEEKAISAEDFFKKSYRDFPEWATLLSGLQNREGLTQKEFGERVDVAQYHISRMERGLRPIGKNIAKRIEQVFKVDYRLFL